MIINRWNPIHSLVSVIDIPPSAVGYIHPAPPGSYPAGSWKTDSSSSIYSASRCRS